MLQHVWVDEAAAHVYRPCKMALHNGAQLATGSSERVRERGRVGEWDREREADRQRKLPVSAHTHKSKMNEERKYKAKENQK